MSLLLSMPAGYSLVDPATPPDAQPVGQSSGWALSMSEEFDAALSVVDDARGLVRMRAGGPVWRSRYPDNVVATWNQSPYTNNPTEGQFYHHDALSISGGALHMTSTRLPIQDTLNPYPGFKYRSGMIQSRDSFTPTFGFFEARMKLPGGPAAWPAFWLFQKDNGAIYHEIDIMECFGSDVTIVANLHLTTGRTVQNVSAPPAYVGSWHTYAAQWSPTEIRWFMDGVQFAHEPATAPTWPMYLIANLAVYKAQTAAALDPLVASIDWIRCWSAA